VTGQLGSYPGVAAVSFGLDPVATAKLSGLASAIVASWVSLWWLCRRSQGSRLVLVSSVLLICEPTLACSAVAGLETGAATLLVVLACAAALRRPQPRPLALGLSVWGIAWLRPELAFMSGVLLLACVTRAGIRRAWPALALASLGALSICVFRLGADRRRVPLAWAAKQVPCRTERATCARAAAWARRSGHRAGRARRALRAQRHRWLGAALRATSSPAFLAAAIDAWLPTVCADRATLRKLGRAGCVRALRGRRWSKRWPWLLFCACGIPLARPVTRVPEWRAAVRAGSERCHWSTFGARTKRSRWSTSATSATRVAAKWSTSPASQIPEIARLPGGHLSKH